MWNNKLKAITFSFDDGVLQDKKVIKLLDKYGCKATFNLNSGTLGKESSIYLDGGQKVSHTKVKLEEIKEIYKNHEVFAHTIDHPNLTTISLNEVIHQVEDDRKTLENLLNKKVIGMAYPSAHPNFNDKVVDIIKNNTGIKFARTVISTYKFDLQDDLYRFQPTIYIKEVDKLFELAKEFIALKPSKPQLFYIWGHSYEFDSSFINYNILEELLKLISGKSDIYYCTNSEALGLK